MERTSTIQTANVITQPVDATERLTLIEKLEQKASQYLQYKNDAKTMHDVRYFGGIVTGLAEAIEIVKQHSDWVRVNERLPPEEIKLLFEHEDYGIIIGCYRKKGEFVTYDTHYNYREPISKFIKWCHIPQSEVQDDEKI